MAKKYPAGDLGKQLKKQDERNRKDAPLIKAMAAKAHEEDKSGFADKRLRRSVLRGSEEHSQE